MLLYRFRKWKHSRFRYLLNPNERGYRKTRHDTFFVTTLLCAARLPSTPSYRYSKKARHPLLRYQLYEHKCNQFINGKARWGAPPLLLNKLQIGIKCRRGDILERNFFTHCNTMQYHSKMTKFPTLSAIRCVIRISKLSVSQILFMIRFFLNFFVHVVGVLISH